jgi:hypothetical protein
VSDDPGESFEEAVENYSAWIDLALKKAERDDWGSLREMVTETPFAASYLYCLVEAYRDLVERHDRIARQHIQIAGAHDVEMDELQAKVDEYAQKVVLLRGENGELKARIATLEYQGPGN